ncbi:hypothetical protein [Streptomyces sp. HUAS TT3]|uniref:hypothetical protein n=1 Tax=Streptomyces sp. HUAS TT3 TaxID=3447510 RepID=UPI003F657ED0
MSFTSTSPAYGDGLVACTPSRAGGGQELAGVVCPRPEALGAWPARVTVLVHSGAWLERIAAAAPVEIKVAVLEPVAGRTQFVRVPAALQRSIRPRG